MATSIEPRVSTENGFDYFSIHNAVAAELGCKTAECRAYVDIFTFKRWLAQGYVVRKGEQGTKITTWIPVTKTDDEGKVTVVGKRPKGVTVFCRHQVDKRR